MRRSAARAAPASKPALTPLATGALVARALRHTWRADPPSRSISEDLARIAIHGGSGGLLARCVTAGEPSFELLRDLRRHQVLESARFEHGLALRIAALRSVGVEPIVIKGWAIARRYPGKGLRHYSDLDLVVERDQLPRADAVLAPLAGDRLAVDLHPGIPHVDGRDPTALGARLVRVPLADLEVQTLGDEDHLWLLALHALGHGLWRSVWLVDLALLIEERGLALDWDYLFAGDPRDVPAVEVALALAHIVLGADIAGTPIARFVDRLPRWVEPALLEEWGADRPTYAPLTTLPRARDLVAEARRRWPNPIRATAAAHGHWDEWPRLPLQLADFARRTLRFARARDRAHGIWSRR